MNSRFDAVDNRFNNVDNRFNSIENRFNSIENRFNNIENRMAQQFWLSVATLATVLVGAAGIVVTVLLAR
jgi:tetrahydromethanopterin S-methyltransferase subunit G